MTRKLKWDHRFMSDVLYSLSLLRSAVAALGVVLPVVLYSFYCAKPPR